jgi:hypothetical protein
MRAPNAALTSITSFSFICCCFFAFEAIAGALTGLARNWSSISPIYSDMKRWKQRRAFFDIGSERSLFLGQRRRANIIGLCWRKSLDISNKRERDTFIALVISISSIRIQLIFVFIKSLKRGNGPRSSLEEACNLLLLQRVLSLEQALVKPIGVLDAGHGVGHLVRSVNISNAAKAHLLHSSGNGDDFLDGRGKSLNIVVPVEDIAVCMVKNN